MEMFNLNSEELKQLQMLLNKMNPVQSTEKVCLDPVSKMIDDIMDEFNFAKVQNAMDCLNWEWRGEYVTMEMLRDEAERLLHGAAEMRLGQYKNEPYNQPIIYSTGGLQASAFCDEDKTKIIALDLKFVLEEWDAEIRD
jgi:hypothetical protein